VPNEQWSVVTTFADKVLAEATLSLLAAEGLPARLESNAFIPGLGSEFTLLVPEQLLRRAQWFLEHPAVSEQELTYLATGQLPDSPRES
jgi:hypothetical protein